MEDSAIIFGLIIFITVVIIYNRSNATKPCDKYVRYFDKTYYKLPKVQAVRELPRQEIPVSLNDRITEIRPPPKRQENFKTQPIRWASEGSQAGYDADNNPQSTNNEVTSEPSTLANFMELQKKNINKIYNVFSKNN